MAARVLPRPLSSRDFNGIEQGTSRDRLGGRRHRGGTGRASWMARSISRMGVARVRCGRRGRDCARLARSGMVVAPQASVDHASHGHALGTRLARGAVRLMAHDAASSRSRCRVRLCMRWRDAFASRLAESSRRAVDSWASLVEALEQRALRSDRRRRVLGRSVVCRLACLDAGRRPIDAVKTTALAIRSATDRSSEARPLTHRQRVDRRATDPYNGDPRRQQHALFLPSAPAYPEFKTPAQDRSMPERKAAWKIFSNP